MAKSKSVWVVIHCEFMGGSKMPRMDEMVFHVASTVRAAERYIRKRRTAPFSWWKLERYPIDVPMDSVSPKTFIHTHTGRRVKDPPWNLAKYRYVQYARKEGW